MNEQMIVTLQKKELNMLVMGNKEFGKCFWEQIIDMHIQMDD